MMKKKSLIYLSLFLTACGIHTVSDTPPLPPPTSTSTATSTTTSLGTSTEIVMTENLRVGSFNIQVFGASKMNKPQAVEVIKKTILRYDLLLIQEIRDTSGLAIQNLLTQVNQLSPEPYQMILGQRSGRTSSKEQYAFFYKAHKLEVLSSYTFDDGVEPTQDLFEREPLVVKFRAKKVFKTFFAIALHAAPDSALAELNALPRVYDDAIQKWGEGSGLIMGDFNADCSYLSALEYNGLSLRSDPAFTWHTTRDLDTTVGNTHCGYDHIISTGPLKDKITGPGQVFNFQNFFSLTQTQALEVSDHFPVEVDLTL